MRCLVLAPLALALAGALNAQDATLKVGQPAPALAIEKWVKGAPVPSFEKGKTYVVEFWATWCGPCVASMPHLSELQKEFEKNNVTIIGVTSVDRRNSLDKVEQMVKDKGDGMGYTVAWDTERKTNAAFMEAAAQNGIPTAFVIDKTGTVAYIGHPMFLDEPLAKLVEGTWDIAKDPAQLAQDADAFFGLYALVESDPKGALEKIAAFEKRHPKLTTLTDQLHFAAGLAAGDFQGAYAVANRMVERAIAMSDAAQLNEVAWSIVDPEKKIEQRDLKLALKAAEKAVELTASKDPNALDTLARVHATSGEYAKAIELQNKAIALAPNNGDFQKTLAEYKAKLPQQ